VIPRVQRDQAVGVILVLAVFCLAQVLLGDYGPVLVSTHSESVPH